MSRPKPTVLLSLNLPGGKIEQILAAEAIYAVFYDGNPINIKILNIIYSQIGGKYKKSSFSNSGHAFNLAEKLNKLYSTELFTVHELTKGVVINEAE